MSDKESLLVEQNAARLTAMRAELNTVSVPASIPVSPHVTYTQEGGNLMFEDNSEPDNDVALVRVEPDGRVSQVMQTFERQLTQAIFLSVNHQVNIYKDNTGSIPLGHTDLEAAIAALPDVGNEQSTIEFADDNAASGVGALRYTVTRISETDYYHELTLSVDVDGTLATVFIEGINGLDDRIRRYIPIGEFDGEWEEIELEDLTVMGYAIELQDDSAGSKLIVQETFTPLQNNLVGVSIGKTLKPDLLEKVGVSSSHAFDTEKSVKPVSLIIFN